MLLEVRLDRLLPHMHNIIEVIEFKGCRLRKLEQESEAWLNTAVKNKDEYVSKV